MRILFISFICVLTCFTQLSAQQNERDPSMEVMTTVVTEETADSVPVMIDVSGAKRTDEIHFDPSGEGSAVILISGRPYSEIELRTPTEPVLTNQYSDSAQVESLRMFAGESRSPENMEISGPSLCNSYTIPESGRLYLRIGGVFKSSNELSGIYTGDFNLECTENSWKESR